MTSVFPADNVPASSQNQDGYGDFTKGSGGDIGLGEHHANVGAAVYGVNQAVVQQQGGL